MPLRRAFATALALGVVLLPAAANASTGWTLQSTPNPNGRYEGSYNQLDGVSCTAASSCTAVGYYGSYQWTLAAYWDGTSWQQQPTPNPVGATEMELRGVKCGAANVCMAVGQYSVTQYSPYYGDLQTLAETWDGSTWSVVPTPNPAGARTSQLNSVACPATTNCIAVGFYQNSTGTNFPLAEHWNGSTWALLPVSAVKGGRLRSISCTSASACTAVGFAGANGLALRWNGSTWKTQTVPKPTGAKSIQLNGVSCFSSTGCTAVGSSAYSAAPTGRTLAEHWTGTAWKIQAGAKVPSGSGQYFLRAISCVSASDCTAIGDYWNNYASNLENTLAEYWNGKAWSIQPTPDSAYGGWDSLLGVSCATATACTAVGDNVAEDGPGTTTTLAMQRT